MKFAYSQKTHLIFTILLISFSSLVFAQELASVPDLELVTTEGYWATFDPLSETQKKEMANRFENTPAEVPPQIGHDVKSLWQHLNRRLRESHLDFKVILESNLPPSIIKEYYLDAKVATYEGKKLTDIQLDHALAKMSCMDLLYLIVQNTHLQMFIRKRIVVLLNHWLPQKSDKNDPFAIPSK